MTEIETEIDTHLAKIKMKVISVRVVHLLAVVYKVIRQEASSVLVALLKTKLIVTVEAETEPVNLEMRTEIQWEENLVAVHEVLQDAGNDVTIEMIGIGLVEVGIGILFLCPRYRCIFPTVM